MQKNINRRKSTKVTYAWGLWTLVLMIYLKSYSFCFEYSLTHSLSHSLNHSLTHYLTHSLTNSHPHSLIAITDYLLFVFVFVVDSFLLQLFRINKQISHKTSLTLSLVTDDPIPSQESEWSYVRMCVRVCVCVSLCVDIYIYIYIYICVCVLGVSILDSFLCSVCPWCSL